MTKLRRAGEYWENDSRNYGTNASQQAIDALLSIWAERTWKSADSRGKTLEMRVAANLSAYIQQDPQADWKRDANGKEKRARTVNRATETQRILGEISGRLLMDDPKQYALLCLHYGAFQYIDTIHWPLHKKAEYIGVEETTYRNRLVKLRRYFVENWPEGKVLQ